VAVSPLHGHHLHRAFIPEGYHGHLAPHVYRRREQRILATIACHSAVKLGDKLSHPEMEALIKDWLTSRYPATCPHGRSICYRLDHKDIARKLDRH
jgi:DNA mismatch repair ATPase MutL